MKKFTLIELITIIVIISILAAIVVLSIQNVRDNAVRAEISSNVKNLETVRDIVITKEQDTSLSKVKPILGSPERIDTDSLYPEYIKSKPKNGIYWIDSFENIYGSIVDLPIVDQEDGSYSWEYPKNAEGINVYKVTPSKKLELVENVKKPKKSFKGGNGERYLFSYTDKLGLETAPVEMYEEGEPKICTISLNTKSFTHNLNNYEEFFVSIASKNNTTKDNNNNIINVEVVQPLNSANSGHYLILSLFNKDFEILKHNYIQLKKESRHSPISYDFEIFYQEHLNNGDYVFTALTQNRYTVVFRLDKDLNLIYWNEIELPERGYGLETFEVVKLNNEEIIIAGNVDFNRPKLIKYNIDKGEIVTLVDIPKLDYMYSYRNEIVHDLVQLSNGNFAINTSTVFGNHYFKRKLIYNESLELIDQISTRGTDKTSVHFDDVLIDYNGYLYSYEVDYYNQEINKYNYDLTIVETYPLETNYYPVLLDYNASNGKLYFYTDEGNKVFNLSNQKMEVSPEEKVTATFTIGEYSYIEIPHYGVYRFKHETLSNLQPEFHYEMQITELELPYLLRHLPVDFRRAFDLLDEEKYFDLIENYNQNPINNGGNPYYPTGKASISTEGILYEVSKLQDEYTYYEEYFDESSDLPSLKKGFEDSLILHYQKNEKEFIAFTRVDSEGNLETSENLNELDLEEYQSSKRIFIDTFYFDFDEQGNPMYESKIYSVKGSITSNLIPSGKERIGIPVVEIEEPQESNGPFPYDVDPCYAGAYMFKADNVSVIYKVDTEGKLIPYAKMDDFVNSIDNFKYGGNFNKVTPLNPYNDVILYYLPNGSIIYLPKTEHIIYG